MRLGGVCFQTAVFLEEAFDHVEPSGSGRSLEVQARAAPGKKRGGVSASVVQGRDHRIPPAGDPVYRRAALQQNLQEPDLQTRYGRMDARRHHAQGRGTGAFRINPSQRTVIEICVHLGAGVGQNLGDLPCVLWCL
jgi:hypothetical protein